MRLFARTPILQGLANHPKAMVAVKTGIATATVFTNDRLSKTYPRTALVLMIAENVAHAMIVAHDYRLNPQSHAR